MAEQNLTVGEVAKRINYSEAQVRTLLRDKKIIGTRAGERGKWQITTESVDSFVGTKTNGTESKEPPKADPKEQEPPKTTVVKPPEPKAKGEDPPPPDPPPVTTPLKGDGSTNFPLGAAILRFFRS